MTSRSFLLAAAAVMLFIGAGNVAAQNKVKEKTKTWTFCSGENYNSNKSGAKELREITLPASGKLSVDGAKNGGITVKGENRSDILVRACVQTWANTQEEANTLLKSVRIDNGSTVKAEAASEENWSVSYQILVPRSTDLNLTANNGGISIDSVEGDLEFKTLNGGLHLSDLAGNVKGRTMNGGLHVELDGNAWKGSGLDLETVNGGVHVSLPDNYSAHFETLTVNGGFHSSFAQLMPPKTEQRRRPGGRVSADLNGGGAPIKLVTTNGGVHIGSDSDDD